MKYKIELFDGKRAFYFYKQYERGNRQYIILTDNQIIRLLNQIINYDIVNLTEEQDSLNILLSNNVSIEINDLKVFNTLGSKYDNYMYVLLVKAHKFLTARNIKTYKKSQKYPTKRVNRTKSKRIPKLIIAGGLAASITITSVIGALVREGQEKEFEKASKPYSTVLPLEETPDLALGANELEEINDDTIKVEFAFEDRTASGKLEETIANCQEYADQWIDRYGLPQNLVYAILAQENGTLNFEINASGACGPGQLQVAEFHNDNAIEHMVVPVYQDNVFTGEYDDFYVADARRLDDPRLEGKNYLVMQDINDHFQIVCAYLRLCINRYRNIFIATDAYNKGLYCFSNVCDETTTTYYSNNLSDFSWAYIIPEAKGNGYGDAEYIWHVLSYLPAVDNQIEIVYNYKDELIDIDLTNTNEYNIEIKR